MTNWFNNWQTDLCEVFFIYSSTTVSNGVQTEAVYKDGAVSTEVKVVDGSEKKKPSLLKTLVGSFVSYFFVAMGFKLVHDILMFVSPQLLK